MQKWLIVGLIIFSQSVNALNGAKDFFSMSLEELMQVEITGSTLTPESLKTAPSAVTVFTQEELKRMGLDTLGELMNLVPGFQLYRSSGSSMEMPFSSRGRRIGQTPAEILVMIDGQRFDSPRSSGNATLAPAYSLKHIEKVEFIRGPGAAIYGSNAMMGVINIVTLSGVNDFSIGYGSYNRRQAYVQSSQTYNDITLDLQGHIEADDGDSFNVQDTFSTNRIDTDDPRNIADIKLKFSWKDTQVNVQHNEFEVNDFYELNTISNNFNSRDGQISSISLKHDFEWKSVNSYFWLSYNRSNASLSSQLTAVGDLLAISNPASNDAMFLNVDFKDYTETRVQQHNDWEINDNSRLQYGVELRRIDAPESFAENNFDLSDLANSNLPIRYYGDFDQTTPVQAASSRDILGLYTQYLHKLYDTTHLTLGLRYDDFTDIDSQLSPRLGLVHELNEQHSLKLLYGEAFRAPSESELNLLNNPFVLGNPDLKPETVQSIDVIWMGQWSDTNVSLGYFESRFKDSIVLIDAGGGAFKYQNVSQDPTKGYEFELSHEFSKHWLIRTSHTYISEKPYLSFREADSLSSLMINYQQAKWNANLIASHAGKRKMATGNSNTNLITLNDYWQLFGKLRYSFTDNFTGFIQVKNLLDKNYDTPPVNTALNEGIPNRGREFLLGLSWQF